MKKFIKRLLRFIYRKIITKFFDIIFSRKKIATKFLGSNYGGWQFLDDKNLNNSVIISCGAGEDVSFDIEMITKYNCKVIFVDPNPRSIKHLDLILQKIGNKRKIEYTKDGKQHIECYDLSKVSIDKIEFVKKAIWTESNKNIKFFYPNNRSHVSLSITNFSNNYDQNSDHIYVETISYSDIIKKFNILELPLIKLDIEGSECNVLNNLLESPVLPKQILVEFDELYTYEINQIKKYNKLHKKLNDTGYKSIVTNSFSNQLYIKND